MRNFYLLVPDLPLSRQLSDLQSVVESQLQSEAESVKFCLKASDRGLRAKRLDFTGSAKLCCQDHNSCTLSESRPILSDGITEIASLTFQSDQDFKVISFAMSQYYIEDWSCFWGEKTRMPFYYLVATRHLFIMFNRPGVAGAFLQSPSVLID